MKGCHAWFITDNVRFLCGSFTRKHLMVMGRQKKRLIWNMIRSNHWQFHGGQSSGFLSVTWDLKLVIKSNTSKQTLPSFSPKYRSRTIFFLFKLNQTKITRTSLKSDRIRFIDLMPWGRHFRGAMECFSVNKETCKSSSCWRIQESPKEVGINAVLVAVAKAELWEVGTN